VTIEAPQEKMNASNVVKEVTGPMSVKKAEVEEVEETETSEMEIEIEISEEEEVEETAVKEEVLTWTKETEESKT